MIGVTEYRNVPYKYRPWRSLMRIVGTAIKQGAQINLFHYHHSGEEWCDVTITWEPEDAGTEIV